MIIINNIYFISHNAFKRCIYISYIPLIFFSNLFFLTNFQLSKNIFKMGILFNCLILVRVNIFQVNIGNTYTNNNVITNLKDLTISNFKEILFQKIDEIKFEIQDSKSMNIWNVDVDYSEN